MPRIIKRYGRFIPKEEKSFWLREHAPSLLLIAMMLGVVVWQAVDAYISTGGK